MACNQSSICASAHREAPCSKCEEMQKYSCDTKCQPFLSNTIDRYAVHQQDLDEQHRRLENKITTMEKFLPALIAINMCSPSADQDTGEPANGTLDRLRKMMSKLAPMPDPVDELVAELETSVKHLDQERKELNDKIINADIQIEKNSMELESLELANREMEEQIRTLESNLKRQASLQTITSDDRLCLARIRELGKDQMKIKSNIRELEEREKVLYCQIEKFFAASEEPCKEKRMCKGVGGSKHHVHKSTRSRKKKDCHSVTIGCGTHTKSIRSKIPVKCPRLNEEGECNYKCAENCDNSSQVGFQTLKTVVKSYSSKTYNCNSVPEYKSSKKSCESSHKVNCASNDTYITSRNKPPKKNCDKPCCNRTIDYE